MLQMNFISDTRKVPHTNVVIWKYVIMNRNKYIYDFSMTVFCFEFPAMQLHLEVLAMIMWERRWQIQKNKEIILHLMKKKKKLVFGLNKVALPHTFCVLKFQ